MKILVGTLSLLALVSSAQADRSTAQADRLFQKGKKLLTEKKYADACPTFEEVDKLDPGIGAKLNVAKCYEDWGRLATAYRWYAEAADMAKKGKDERGPKIRELMEELDSNVPRLTLKVREDADPDVVATLKMDGKVIAPSTLNTELRVDPGPHSIEFEVEGSLRRKMAPVERGGESEITLDIPPDDGKSPVVATSGEPRERVRPPKGKPVDGPASPGRTRKIIGISVASVGVVALGVAGIVTLSAKSKYSDALDANCMGSPSMCDDIGLRDTGDARSAANTATVVTLLGLAAVGTGIVLYLTAPPSTEKQAVAARKASPFYVAPVVSGSGGGFALGGSF